MDSFAPFRTPVLLRSSPAPDGVSSSSSSAIFSTAAPGGTAARCRRSRNGRSEMARPRHATCPARAFGGALGGKEPARGELISFRPQFRARGPEEMLQMSQRGEWVGMMRGSAKLHMPTCCVETYFLAIYLLFFSIFVFLCFYVCGIHAHVSAFYCFYKIREN